MRSTMERQKDITIRPQINKIEKKHGCIQSALEILGDKWSPLLLGHLFEQDRTFGDLEGLLPGISLRTLSARLDDLLSCGILDKKLYCKHPPRYKYSLTDKGQDLRTILIQMANWGEKYNN